MAAANPFQRQPPPHAPKPGAFARVLRLLSDLTAFVLHRTTALLAPATVATAGRALIRLHALMLCLKSPQTPQIDPFGLPKIFFGPIPEPTSPASFTSPAAARRPCPYRPYRPRAPRTVAEIHRRAARRMEAKLAVYTVGEILITICRDLGILPNFDDWTAEKSARKRPKTPTPTRTTENPPSFPLWAVPLHPSG